MKKSNTVLFQGDSITDCGRPYDREGKSYDELLGHGYVKAVAGRLPLSYPDCDWHLINYGLSGNKVTQLHARWQTEALNQAPDIISILVGVNDVWHGLPDPNKDYNGVPSGHYDRTFRLLLDWSLETLPNVKFILGEPFLLRGRVWTQDFQAGVEERQQIVRKIAEDYDAPFVPYQAAFDSALDYLTVDQLAPDGVHPTNIGNTVMADAWLQTFKEIV